MSLINQALRKAQQDRSPQRPADADAPAGSVTPPPASMPRHTQNGPDLSLLILLIAVAALFIGLSVGLSFVLLRTPTPSPDPGGLTASAATAPPQAEAPLSGANPPSTPAEPLAPLFTQSPAPAPVALPADAAAQIETLRLAREAAEAQAKAETENAAKAPTVVEWLSRSRITGVKVAPNGSRVILNGTAYAEGDTVNFELGLKVLIIEEARVLFADDGGKKYMKRL